MKCTGSCTGCFFMICKNSAYHIEFIILTSMHRVMHRVDNGPGTPGGPDHRNAAPRVRPQAPRYCFGSFPAPDPRRIPPRFRRLKECTRRYIKHAANIPSIPDGTHGGFPIAFPSAVSTASLSLDGIDRFNDANFSPWMILLSQSLAHTAREGNAQAIW